MSGVEGAARKRADEQKVIEVLMDFGWWGGFELSRASKVRASRMYPALDRLMAEGLVIDRWDDSTPSRRLYQIATVIL